MTTLRVWAIIATVAVTVLFVAAGWKLLQPTPTTADRLADAVKVDTGGSCSRVDTQRRPAHDDDGSGFQAEADTTYLINCADGSVFVQLIEYPSRASMLGGLKLRPRSTIYGGEQVCVLEHSLVFASFEHAKTLPQKCAQLGGKIQAPVSKP